MLATLAPLALHPPAGIFNGLQLFVQLSQLFLQRCCLRISHTENDSIQHPQNHSDRGWIRSTLKYNITMLDQWLIWKEGTSTNWADDNTTNCNLLSLSISYKIQHVYLVCMPSKVYSLQFPHFQQIIFTKSYTFFQSIAFYKFFFQKSPLETSVPHLKKSPTPYLYQGESPRCLNQAAECSCASRSFVSKRFKASSRCTASRCNSSWRPGGFSPNEGLGPTTFLGPMTGNTQGTYPLVLGEDPWAPSCKVGIWKGLPTPTLGLDIDLEMKGLIWLNHFRPLPQHLEQIVIKSISITLSLFFMMNALFASESVLAIKSGSPLWGSYKENIWQGKGLKV